MAIDSKRIKVSELDFDTIKANLINYLRGQSEFSDYDFEGSGLSVLLDVLAYNTHYNAIYTNLAVNEMFLDSASKRSSVVSLAKTLGYTPHSARSAIATVDLVVRNTTSYPPVLTLPSNSAFTTVVDGKTYSFYNSGEVSATLTSGSTYTFSNIEIKEGIPLSFKYTVADGQKYVIPNANVDMSTLTVRVQDSATSDYFVTFNPASSLVDLESTSNVYFSKEIDGGMFEIVFGDGVLSSAVTNGNVVHLDYFVSNTVAPNGARVFSYNGPTLLGGTTTVSVVSVAAGGAYPETIDSIKFNAPKLYTAQNRAVTPEDYKALIYANYPYIKSVSVWGGEDNSPPVYGKTFICAKPQDATKLTSQQKTDILTSLLSSRNVVSITPEIVDPEYISIGLNITAYYNERETVKSSSQLRSQIIDTVYAYDENELQRFDGMFRYSKMSRLIDQSDAAITHNITTVVLRRKIDPRYNVSAEYVVNLINPIYTEGVPEQAISSSGFYIYGSDTVHYLEDDGIGNVQLFYHGAADTTQSSTGTITTHIVVDPKIGTVDYANGIVTIRNLNITALADAYFELTIKPQSNDVVSAYNQIAEIDKDNLVVNVIADKASNGDLRAGKNYTFTSSRS